MGGCARGPASLHTERDTQVRVRGEARRGDSPSLFEYEYLEQEWKGKERKEERKEEKKGKDVMIMVVRVDARLGTYWGGR